MNTNSKYFPYITFSNTHNLSVYDRTQILDVGLAGFMTATTEPLARHGSTPATWGH